LDDTGINGPHGGFGEIGHAILHTGGRPCTCGQLGCVEQYISGTALWTIYNEMIGQPTISSGYEFFKLIDRNDLCAKKVLEGFIQDLAVCAVTCANLYDPEALLFGGGIIDTYSYWWDSFLDKYNYYGNIHTRKVQLIRAVKGNDAAVLGAASIAFKTIS
jgi:glucokinase